jgi:hypothetical protein
MGATLIADYPWILDANGLLLPEDEWPPEVPGGGPDFGRIFWTLVLLLASRDRATSAQVLPRLGEGCLSVTVDGVNYEIVPPPKELRGQMYRAARDLSAGSRWRGILWWWKAHVFRRQSSSLVTLEFLGNRIEWTATFGPHGLVFQRGSETGGGANAAEHPNEVADRDVFRFAPELFEVRNAVIAELRERGFEWLTHYSAVDVMHDVYGIEVCGIHKEDDASNILAVLRQMFPSWSTCRTYHTDHGRDQGYWVTIQRDPEPPDEQWATAQ